MLLAVAAVATYVLLTPLGSGLFLRSLERHPPLPLSAGLTHREVGAIVVLGADYCTWAPEFGGETVGTLTLERMRYAAALQRATGLPMLVTGGRFQAASQPLAVHMRDLAERELGVAVRWVEPTAVNTFENARQSATILAQAGIRRAYLVTHAWHMRRALACFRDSGLEVIPAPTRLTPKPTPLLRDLVPVAACLRASAWGIHETIALAWYHWTHFKIAQRDDVATAMPPGDGHEAPAGHPKSRPTGVSGR
jgi:uncharacterized SAM-binding protein YcdF (DUF218 family)